MSCYFYKYCLLACWHNLAPARNTEIFTSQNNPWLPAKIVKERHSFQQAKLGFASWAATAFIHLLHENAYSLSLFWTRRQVGQYNKHPVRFLMAILTHYNFEHFT